jgi:hypothetical protein
MAGDEAAEKPSRANSGASGGDKKKLRKKKIPTTTVEEAPAAANASATKGNKADEYVGPMRMEGCGPCKRSVPDVPLSDAGRSPRDILCALFFLCFCIGDLVIALVGFSQGQPSALIYGLDFDGQVCGRNNQARALVGRGAPRHW